MAHNSERKHWLSVLAKAPPIYFHELYDQLDQVWEYDVLRAAEIGAVMVRGAMGGSGDTFNLGEMTITRCSVKLREGSVGHGYVQGRDKLKAERVAVLDALLQTQSAPQLMAHVIGPLQDYMHKSRRDTAQKAAATKVEFFTLVRGED